MNTQVYAQNQPQTGFEELLKEYEFWLDYGEPHRPYSEHTKRAYKREVRKFIAFLGENLIENPDEITNAVFRRYFAENHENGAKPSTIRSKLSAIDNFFEWAYMEEKLPLNPVSRYKKLSSKKGRGGRVEIRLPEALTREQVETLLNAVYDENRRDAKRNAALLALLADTGIRVSELIDLTISDGINLVEQNAFRVIGKGDKERKVVPMGIFDGFYSSYIKMRIDQASSNRERLFTTRSGKSLSQSMIFKIIRRHIERLGFDVKQTGPHLLRHTAATLMLANGLDVVKVQAILGHSNLSVTSRYLHAI